MNNPMKFLNKKEYLLKKEAFMHNPSDRLNMIPWSKLIYNKKFIEILKNDESFMELYLNYSYDYEHIPRLIDFKTK